MSALLEKYREYTTEYLLELRARGEEGLTPEAHRAVEDALRERGAPVPPLPARPIAIDPESTVPRRSTTARNAVLVVAALLAMGLSNALAKTWVGLVFTALIGVYFIVEWLRHQNLSPDERSAEDTAKRAQADGLSDLMTAAAEGDVARVKDLLAYGARVDDRSDVGATALMYAARNNRTEVVSLLLAAGANAALKTPKGGSASDFAARAGHAPLAELLKRAER